MVYSKEGFKGLVAPREIMGLVKKVVFIGLCTYFVYKTVESVGKHQRKGVIHFLTNEQHLKLELHLQ